MTMLFESRKILVGFRIKLTFDTSLKRDNSYIFINLSETPTIEDLLRSIKKRFEISREIYIALDDCRLLNSEDNSVLIDVLEAKIVPCENETISPPSKTSLDRPTFPRDSLSGVDLVARTVELDQVLNKTEVLPAQTEKLSCDKQQNGNAFCARENTNRKSRRFYSSIAETLKYLNQSYKPELENSSKLANDVLMPEGRDYEEESKMNAVKQQDTVDNVEEACYLNNGDELAVKRKRKRKRKHSKKLTLESDHSEVVDNTHVRCDDSNLKTKTNSLPIESTRQHIFFNVEDENNAEVEKHPSKCNLSVDSCSPIRSSSEKARKLETTFENIGSDVFGTNGIVNGADDSSKLGGNENIEKHFTTADLASDPNAIPLNQSLESETKLADKRKNSYLKRSESEDPDALSTTNTKHRTKRKKSTDLPWKAPLHNDFFSTFKTITKDCVDFQTKENPPENSHPLSTLLMCKQLQTPVEYSVQFKQSNAILRSRSNSCVSVECKKPTTNSSTINENSAVPIDKNDENSINCDECEVLCQYKIVDDTILLRDPNGLWNILSKDEAFEKLQPVEEPQENQSITFQLLYLGPNMCPSMSDLMCGKVISFQKDSGRLILNILPSFIHTLLKSYSEETCLPDELVHIVDNTYQVSWIAVKNPRLLM